MTHANLRSRQLSFKGEMHLQLETEEPSVPHTSPPSSYQHGLSPDLQKTQHLLKTHNQAYV